jgi:hypothetical protein
LAGLETGPRLTSGMAPLYARCGALQAGGSAVGRPGDDVAGSGRSKERGRKVGRRWMVQEVDFGGAQHLGGDGIREAGRGGNGGCVKRRNRLARCA